MRALIRAALPILLALGAAGCNDAEAPEVRATGGNPHRGRALVTDLGCGTCHSIPGIRRARGRVGPPLDHVGTRTILAGVLPNTPDNMLFWIRTPQSVVPGNAMPNMELSDANARDVAAYLYTLR